MQLEINPASSALRGALAPPGDKSISHRALIFSSLAEGTSRIAGLLDAADTRATADALRQLGAEISREGAIVTVHGLGGTGLQQPGESLDMGNSGTAMRLLSGVLAAHPFESVLVGDESLSRRPMRRIIKPLEMMGARIESEPDGTAPLRIHGTGLRGIDYASPVASAQVKSCVLLAGLYARGRTSVSEPSLSRDHTERMLPLFGVPVLATCAVDGGAELKAADLEVPSDPSSAAFLLAAALVVEGSEVVLENVSLNETRCGFFETLRDMGADLETEPVGHSCGDPVGRVRVRYTAGLRGVDLPVERIPSMIDEIPVLMALAATAKGDTRIRGAAELRHKESDRLAVMCRGLKALGVSVREYPDGVDITGGYRSSVRTEQLDAALDHRCAMSFAILGLATPGGVTISGCENIDTSYPGFVEDLARLGADIKQR